MTIEGLLEYEMIRDFLYSKMRGMKEKSRQSEHTATVSNATLGAVLDLHTAEALTVALREVSSELRAIRLALEQKKP